MPTIFTHAVLAAGAFTLVADRGRGARLGAVYAAAVSMLPDIDVLWWGFTSYGEPWGHRGMSHSLTAAVVIAALMALWLRRRVAFPVGGWGLFALFTLVIASHGVLDALTDGGKGIGFFLPFDERRYFLPVQPVPVAPIGGGLASPWLWRVLAVEVLLFWPLAAAMAWWRRPIGAEVRFVIALALAVSVTTWIVRT